MYKQILVPVDLADPELAKPAISTACAMAKASGGAVRLVNVLPMTPVMLAEYVPPDFDVQQRKSAEEAMAMITRALEHFRSRGNAAWQDFNAASGPFSFRRTSRDSPATATRSPARSACRCGRR